MHEFLVRSACLFFSTISNLIISMWFTVSLIEDERKKCATTWTFQACHQDPLLDDSITFARHLRSLSVEHHVVIVHNLPHGFLNFYNANQNCKQASDRIISDLARRFQIAGPLFVSSKKKKQRRQKMVTAITNPIFPLWIIDQKVSNARLRNRPILWFSFSFSLSLCTYVVLLVLFSIKSVPIDLIETEWTRFFSSLFLALRTW